MAKKRSKADLSRFAVEVRKTDLGLSEYQRLCPYDLATEHGVDVYTLIDLAAAGCCEETIGFFTAQRPEAWSAALVPSGNGQFIVENAAHSPRRRRSNVAHEMAHLLLEHEFDRILFGDGNGRCRNSTSGEVEDEAAYFSGELLLPAAAARKAAVNKMSDGEVADLFDVSIEFARWRINVSGARTIAQRIARKRTA